MAEGLDLGEDFSIGYTDEQPVLLISSAREGLLFELLPAERHGLLRAFLQPLEGVAIG
jgi:hypothetical protein